MSDNSQIQEIILRYLNGESSEEEARKLHEWINRSSSNSDEFGLTKRLWADSGDAALLPADTEKAWQNVSAHTINKQTKVVKMFTWRRAIAVAASIILIFGVYYFFNQTSKANWDVTLAENANKKVELPDGTFITMRKGSKLSVPENYGKEKREVKLDGEAFFEVKHDGKNPFSIITARSIIKDIGTAFLVESTDSLEQVTVIEGVVSFAAKEENKASLILRAGESAVLVNEIPQRKNIDTTNVLSWSSKVLIFNNTPLSQAAKDIKDYYQTEVEVADSLGSIKITAQFRNETLEQVVKELRLFTGLQFQMSGNKLLISK